MLVSSMLQHLAHLTVSGTLENIGVPIQIAIPKSVMPLNIHEKKSSDAILLFFSARRKGRTPMQRQVISVV